MGDSSPADLHLFALVEGEVIDGPVCVGPDEVDSAVTTERPPLCVDDHLVEYKQSLTYLQITG